MDMFEAGEDTWALLQPRYPPEVDITPNGGVARTLLPNRLQSGDLAAGSRPTGRVFAVATLCAVVCGVVVVLATFGRDSTAASLRPRSAQPNRVLELEEPQQFGDAGLQGGGLEGDAVPLTSPDLDGQCTDNYCAHRASGSITGSQEHLMSLCVADVHCSAIDYRAIGGYGHLCQTAEKNPPSSGYLFCLKPVAGADAGQANAYADNTLSNAGNSGMQGAASSNSGLMSSNGNAADGAQWGAATDQNQQAMYQNQQGATSSGLEAVQPAVQDGVASSVNGQIQDGVASSENSQGQPYPSSGQGTLTSKSTDGYYANFQTSVQAAAVVQTTTPEPTFTTTMPSTTTTFTFTTTTFTITITNTTTLTSTTTTTHVPTLFCFALMMPKGYEVDLLGQLINKSAGIFACDQYSVFSDGKHQISKHPRIITGDIGSVECDYGGPWHLALNSEIFFRVWKKVFHDELWKANDWTVKVDPDAVFLPERLKLRVFDRDPASNVYLNNCDQGLHGPIEVVANGGMKTFAEGMSTCHEKLEHEWDWSGEDVFLRHCLGLLEVNRVDDFHLLTEMVCFYEDPIEDGCVTGKVSFHPFKTPEKYFQCLDEASSATEADADAAEVKRIARQIKIEARDKAKKEGRDPDEAEREALKRMEEDARPPTTTTTPPPADVCEDDNDGAIRMAAGLRVDSAGCIEMSDMCLNGPDQYGPQVRKYCRKTCNLCGPGAVAPPSLMPAMTDPAATMPPQVPYPPAQPMAQPMAPAGYSPPPAASAYPPAAPVQGAVGYMEK